MKIRKILAAAGLAALLGTAAQAQTQSCSLALMASLDMTPLTDGRVAVPVSINGTTHEFMVDTAGVYSQISAEAAQKLGLKEAQTDTELYGGSGRLRINPASVASFKVGNNEARNFHLGVSHENAAPSEKAVDSNPQVDGLLSPDFLSLFDVELDFAAKKMNLFSQDHCPGKVVYWTRSGYTELPFRYTSGMIAAVPHINLQMTLDGHDVSADVDTGSTNTWIRKKAAERIFSVDENSPGVVKSPYASAAFAALRKQFGALTLGGLAVQNPQVDILPDLEDDAFRMAHSEKSRDDPIYGDRLASGNFILGMNVLSKLHLFIAYKEHKIYVTAADAH